MSPMSRSVLGLATLLCACSSPAAAPDAGLEGGLPVEGGPREARPADLPAADFSIYGGRLLGANVVAPGLVEFTLFAPDAKSVAVAAAFNNWSEAATPLSKRPDGIWRALVSIASPAGKQYEFVLDGDKRVADPYAKANVQARGRSVIVDSSYAWKDGAFQRPPRERLVIYELNLADFTSDPSSGVDAILAGTYAGMEKKIDYLTKLGVTAVELMPIAEYCSDAYSWGYDPSFFFAPEAGLASAPTGEQVDELKHLVDALHGAGIAVIVDMVFNHIAHNCNPLWTIDPVYYFDYNNDGDPTNDALPWGEHLATWRPMARKLMFDSLKLWMDAYHVDGFRLDSTENIDGDALQEVLKTLAQRGYGDRHFIAEEWSSAHNAAIRAMNAAEGAVLLSSWGTSFKNVVWEAVTKGAASTANLGRVTYYSHDEGWNLPAEVVNFFSSHDEGTLSTRWGASKQQVKVAALHLLTSLGLPMIWSGDEFLRVHYGNYIPGGKGATWKQNNIVDWSLAETNADLVSYYAALIKLRVAHPALHLNVKTPDGTPDYFDWSTASWTSAVGESFKGVAGDHDFVALSNFEAAPREFTVNFPRTGTWYLMCDGTTATDQAPGLQTLAVAASPMKITVPAQSSYLYMSQAANP
jgi:pullulanase/glycogen debranching enzyme